jgi:hypothetical protein
MVEYKIVTFDEWRQQIQPLWDWNTDWHWIPIINNPYGMVQYHGVDTFVNTIVFPIMCTVDGVPAAYTNVYNISDTHIRIRGIYVEPEFRGQKLVSPMLDYAVSLFPDPWHTCIGYYRNTNIDYFLKIWFDEKVPGYEWRGREVGDRDEGDYSVTLLRKHF